MLVGWVDPFIILYMTRSTHQNTSPIVAISGHAFSSLINTPTSLQTRFHSSILMLMTLEWKKYLELWKTIDEIGGDGTPVDKFIFPMTAAIGALHNTLLATIVLKNIYSFKRPDVCFFTRRCFDGDHNPLSIHSACERDHFFDLPHPMGLNFEDVHALMRNALILWGGVRKINQLFDTQLFGWKVATLVVSIEKMLNDLVNTFEPPIQPHQTMRLANEYDERLGLISNLIAVCTNDQAFNNSSIICFPRHEICVTIEKVKTLEGLMELFKTFEIPMVIVDVDNWWKGPWRKRVGFNDPILEAHSDQVGPFERVIIKRRLKMMSRVAKRCRIQTFLKLTHEKSKDNIWHNLPFELLEMIIKRV